MKHVRPFFLYATVFVLLGTGYLWFESRLCYLRWEIPLDTTLHVHGGSVIANYAPGSTAVNSREDDGFVWEKYRPEEVGHNAWPWGEFDLISFKMRASSTAKTGFMVTVPIWLPGLLLAAILLACGAVRRKGPPASSDWQEV